MYSLPTVAFSAPLAMYKMEAQKDAHSSAARI
jgi:hypothetical protein